MRIRALGRVAAATALAAVASLLSTSGAHSADYQVRDPAFVAAATPQALFNNPREGNTDEIRDRLVDLVDHAEPGTSITGSMYLFNDGAVADALVNANKNGVKIRLVLDSEALPVPGADWLAPENTKATGVASEFPKLVRQIGVDRTKDSYVYVCPRFRGCVGGRPAKEIKNSDPINHNKYFLFEKVGAVPAVVFQTSANLTDTQKAKYYNNAVTVPDRPLYDAYQKYFADQLSYSSAAAGKPDYHQVVPAGPNTAYFGPRRETGEDPYAEPATDTVLDLLAPVDCAGGATKIRVAMFAFTRTQVADRLVQLRAAKCQVYVFLNNEPGSIGSTAKDTLQRGGLNHLGACSSPAGQVPAYGLHSKYMLIEGTYDKVPNRELVFTGSQNYTYPSLRGYDETILKIDDHAVYGAFEDNFDRELNGFPGYSPPRTGSCVPLT
ncbi:phospholipase D-like domain-containing protein [Streptomyces sp. H34-S4]|uniref:phospholipase D-like domain-containing protein n=1 Tax=Streptomyces sp. H34-S4 TaxID=2996463 RepID=UPI00226F88B7|nr:phospholipase D-like domain-containing protein [Streptomyces sp. H34-S4]MCY0934363.1 phospholipase D-like domain-containing protein [Streptomyces sp. H34-S4]